LFHIVLTEYVYLEDAAAVKHYHDLFVAMGYEGIMIRNLEGLYESGKRSADLQKYKEFLDAEFLILRVSKDKDGRAVYELKNDVNDEEFSCVIGSHKQRLKDVSGLNVGKYMTVKFQARYDGTELPQFPTGVAIRDYE
jgi:DNA ligase-1